MPAPADVPAPRALSSTVSTPLRPSSSDCTPALTLTLRELTPRIARHGNFNFMLSNGQALWAHCSTNLFAVERKHPFAHAQLADEDLSIDFARNTTPHDKVAVVVTAPLTTNESWTALSPGELRVFVDGEAVG